MCKDGDSGVRGLERAIIASGTSYIRPYYGLKKRWATDLCWAIRNWALKFRRPSPLPNLHYLALIASIKKGKKLSGWGSSIGRNEGQGREGDDDLGKSRRR
ncbi:hypothetical protein R6Q57_007285 [Mikania cordata]